MPHHPPEPSTLHQAFATARPLDWGGNLSTADLVSRHGVSAAWRSLWILEQVATVESTVTEQFLASLPSYATPYQLDRRVKSPDSLARKLQLWTNTGRRFPIDDILRYTVLTESPDELIAATRTTIDQLNDQDWRVTSANQSYIDASPYKALHAYLAAPAIARAEIQFHSVASAQIKELTKRAYEISLDETASPTERAAAHKLCVAASATLQPPADLHRFKRLGGKRVTVPAELSTDPISHPTTPPQLPTVEEIPTNPGDRMNHLPEPADLHAWLTSQHPLDWGNPIPTKAELAATYGTEATSQSLTLLTRAAAVERHITDDVEGSISSGTAAYQLESRLKSPQSLARKIRKLAGTGFDTQPLEDVVRYTIVTPQPDDLIPAAADACDSLAARGWEMNGAVNSYADGSRYKGLHLFLQSRGQRVELQIHSRESIDVKTRTTPLYLVERDPDQPREMRTEARNESIALSAQMRQPAGIDNLTTLGGVPVEVRVYGRRGRQPAARAEGVKPLPAEQSASQQPMDRNRKNGVAK